MLLELTSATTPYCGLGMDRSNLREFRLKIYISLCGQASLLHVIALKSETYHMLSFCWRFAFFQKITIQYPQSLHNTAWKTKEKADLSFVGEGYEYLFIVGERSRFGHDTVERSET
jgi:hypothetical protein